MHIMVLARIGIKVDSKGQRLTPQDRQVFLFGGIDTAALHVDMTAVVLYSCRACSDSSHSFIIT